MRHLIILLAALFFCSMSNAQINIGGKIKDKAQEKLEQKTDQTIDKGFDKTEEGVNGVFKKKDKDKNKDGEDTKSEGEAKTEKTDDGENTDGNTSTNATISTPSLQSYTKYDFVPGDQILFFEDFSQDAIGDFPALWTTDGTGEVRTLNNYPGQWLYMNGDGSAYCLMKDLVLPTNFIVEFDVVTHNEKADADAMSFCFNLYSSDKDWLIDASWPGTAGFYVNPSYYRTSAKAHAPDMEFVELNSDVRLLEEGKLNHFIFWVQNRRLRVYVAGQKILDGPTALPEGITYNRLRFHMWGEQGQHFISNIKITTAAPDTRSKLLTEGKLISYGIYFDSGKDVVKAESYGALKDIAKVLTENPDVKIKVVGHTDADGDDASNLDLSKRRAANVKNALVKDFAIDASRIETDGSGESQPIAPNDNPENKAKNRRVEFIKL
ncbi:MAG TPA: OmpA family protein [Bacteroidales bacterium]|nr:OmpA family protein [Bacteroidales bacterium]